VYYEDTIEEQHKKIPAENLNFVLLLCLHNTLITTNFDVLKYIKKIFKIPTSTKKTSRESGLRGTVQKIPAENLNHILLILLKFCFYVSIFFSFC